MKKFILLLSMVFIFGPLAAQNVSIEAAYLPGGYGIKYIQPTPATTGNTSLETVFHYGHFMTDITASVDILKHFEISGSQRIYMESSGAFMKPTQAEWHIGIAVKLGKKLKIGYDHLCIHPLRTDAVSRVEMFGGYNKIYVRFDAKIW